MHCALARQSHASTAAEIIRLAAHEGHGKQRLPPAQRGREPNVVGSTRKGALTAALSAQRQPDPMHALRQRGEHVEAAGAVVQGDEATSGSVALLNMLELASTPRRKQLIETIMYLFSFTGYLPLHGHVHFRFYFYASFL